jgi:hypothetical protein
MHRFENLFYILGTGEFFVWNGLQYRSLPYLAQAKTEHLFVHAYDTEGKHAAISLVLYRRMINDIP